MSDLDLASYRVAGYSVRTPVEGCFKRRPIIAVLGAGVVVFVATALATPWGRRPPNH